MKREDNRMDLVDEYLNLPAGSSSLDRSEHPATSPLSDISSVPKTCNLVDLTNDVDSDQQNEVVCGSSVLIDGRIVQRNPNSEHDSRHGKSKVSAGLIRNTEHGIDSVLKANPTTSGHPAQPCLSAKGFNIDRGNPAKRKLMSQALSSCFQVQAGLAGTKSAVLDNLSAQAYKQPIGQQPNILHSTYSKGSFSVVKPNSAGSSLVAEDGGFLQANPAASICKLQSSLPGCSQDQAMPDTTNHVIPNAYNVSHQINSGTAATVQANHAVNRQANQGGPVTINKDNMCFSFQTHREHDSSLLPSTGVASMIPVKNWYPNETFTGSNHIGPSIPPNRSSIVQGGPSHWYPHATSTGLVHNALGIPSHSTSIVQVGPSRINPLGGGIPFQAHQEQGSAVLSSTGVAPMLFLKHCYPYASSTGPNHDALGIPSHNTRFVQGGPSGINHVGLDARDIPTRDLKGQGLTIRPTTTVGGASNQNSSYRPYQGKQSLEEILAHNAQMAAELQMLTCKKRNTAGGADLYNAASFPEKGRSITPPTLGSCQNNSMCPQNMPTLPYQEHQHHPIDSYVRCEVPDFKPLGERCQLCGIDLAFTPAGSGSSGRPPVHAVLPCGHCFHNSCLESVFGAPEPSQIPPCISCLE